jgi:hypothetical protein
VADICNAAADLNVQALNAAAAKLSEKPSPDQQAAADDGASGVCAA